MDVLPPDWERPAHWVVWLGLAALGEVVWFATLYPLVPTTVDAACLLAFLPLLLASYVYGALRCLMLLADCQWPPSLKRAAQLAIAVSVGVVSFGLVVAAELLKRGEFGYLWVGKP